MCSTIGVAWHSYYMDRLCRLYRGASHRYRKKNGPSPRSGQETQRLTGQAGATAPACFCFERPGCRARDPGSD